MANNNHFELTLDTIAPSGSITRPAQYVNAQTTLTIATGDATFMYIWFDQDNSTSTIPSGLEPITAASSYTSQFSADGVYYYHVVLEDSVGNQSQVYTTEEIHYDITAPTVPSVELVLRDGTKTELTKTREIAVEFTGEDNLSGIVSCAISGDINIELTNWSSTLSQTEINTLEAHEAVRRNIVLSGSEPEDTTKTVTITVTDAAGNTSATSTTLGVNEPTDTIVLDTQFLTGNIILQNASKSAVITNQWVNYQDINVRLELGSATAGDVVGYKIWGDINDDGGAQSTSEPLTYTAVAVGTNPIDIAKQLTSGDSASKTVYAKVIDDAGNETPLTSVITKYDGTAPDVAITCPTVYVSKVSGHDTAIITPTVNASISGTASYELKMGDSAYPSASGSGDVPETFTVSSANMGTTDGAKNFTLTVVDNAGNSKTSAVVVIYLDTQPPTGSITMNAWYNGDTADQTTYKKFSTAGATASATDKPNENCAGMAYMTCWCSTNPTDTTVRGTRVAYAANPTHAQIDWTIAQESNSNYIHIEYVDAVGNSAIIHSNAFGIDTVAPGNGEIHFSKDFYTSTDAVVDLIYNDATSTVEKFKVWGDIEIDGTQVTQQTASWNNIASSHSVTLTTPDGNKTVYVQYKDVAGNMSVGSPFPSTTAELDTEAPTATLILRKPDDSGVKDSPSNVATFKARVSGTDDGETGRASKYVLYGDFGEGSAPVASGTAKPDLSVESNWNDLVYDSGESYMTISGLACTVNATEGAEEKDIYLYVKDNAGNVYPHAEGDRTIPAAAGLKVFFIYDNGAPVATVSNIDHNIISKVYTKRRVAGTHETCDCYNDEMHFTLSSNETYQAWKVCAYTDKAATDNGNGTQTKKYSECITMEEQNAWVEAQVAIPMSAGSQNMSMVGVERTSEQTVACMIKGADFESALNGGQGTVTDHSFDGLHYVVAYVQDMGGTWSVAAEFSA